MNPKSAFMPMLCSLPPFSGPSSSKYALPLLLATTVNNPREQESPDTLGGVQINPCSKASLHLSTRRQGAWGCLGQVPGRFWPRIRGSVKANWPPTFDPGSLTWRVAQVVKGQQAPFQVPKPVFGRQEMDKPLRGANTYRLQDLIRMTNYAPEARAFFVLFVFKLYIYIYSFLGFCPRF